MTDKDKTMSKFEEAFEWFNRANWDERTPAKVKDIKQTLKEIGDA